MMRGSAMIARPCFQVIMPIARAFDPSIVLVSAGFDAAGSPQAGPESSIRFIRGDMKACTSSP